MSAPKGLPHLGFCLSLALALLAPPARSATPASDATIYVALGFHTNFYHSWRGDTPDEAGFGTDIRVVRGILDILDRANAQGLDARAYWEFDNLFTLESILPRYAPDIIERVRQRVAAGVDEVILAPYNNGMFSAMTEEEMRATLHWAVRNPWGSGVADLFPSHSAILRPQEYMFTTGAIPVLQSAGIHALVLAYSNYPFTAFSNFTPVLPTERRFNPLWLQTASKGPGIVLLPAASLGDIVNFGSFEKWLLDLRRWQLSQSEPQDLLLHINFDADAETWLPMELPRWLRWLPNTRGLQEYIDVVNRYRWAKFTTLAEYLETHDPLGTVVVRQDMADGAWDGLYSWTEKFPSQLLWTQIEQSRLAERRALALVRELDDTSRERVRAILLEGRTSAFFERVRALSTTHFGMSTPLVNEERQAAAESIAASAFARARQAEQLAAQSWRKRQVPSTSCDYELLVVDVRAHGSSSDAIVAVPLWWHERPQSIEATTASGQRLDAALFDVAELGPPGRGVRGELWFHIALAPQQRERVCVRLASTAGGDPGEKIGNEADRQRLRPLWDSAGKLVSLQLEGKEFAHENWISPFVTYRTDSGPRTFRAAWQAGPPQVVIGKFPGERRRSYATISFPTADGNATTEISVTWTVFPNTAGVIADVDVQYPYTLKRDVLHTLQQKLRRYIDLRWIEVGPFELAPVVDGSREAPLRVWKHNWLGVTSSYDLDYGRINPANAALDSFNHQVTAGWVAVSDGNKGLLIAQSADVWSSAAFAPMRLREIQGRQRLWINPFGSYHGRQMSYAHLGGSGIAQEVAEQKGAQFRPNGPSFNGQRQRFRLLLAPYLGDEPPKSLQDRANAFFYPPAVVYLRSPAGEEVAVPRDMEAWIQRRTAAPLEIHTTPPPPPRAFLVNPTDRAAHLVWDPPASGAVVAYEVAWRRVGSPGWLHQRVQGTRAAVPDLENGVEYEFRVRAIGSDSTAGRWTPAERIRIGAVEAVGFREEARGLSPGLLLRVFWHSIRAAIAAWWIRTTMD